MRYWDVFHSVRLEAERSLTTEAVRQAIARGDLQPDDLIRPAGETGWTRLDEAPEFAAITAVPEPIEEPPPPAEFPPPSVEFAPPSIEAEDEFDVLPEDHGQSEFEIDPGAFAAIDRDDLRQAEPEPEPKAEPEGDYDFVVEYEDDPEPAPAAVGEVPLLLDEETQRGDLDEYDDPIPDIDFEELDPQDEDDEAAEFTLSRNKAETVEELDLAAMVDVAFQLVLFFLVTAQVVLFKTLEIPKPNEDKPPDAAVQAKAKTVDELEKDYILVEVDAAGTIKIDRQPVPAQRSVLVETLRKTREETQRKAMLLSADFATRHEHAVLVFDVANEIDLKIAIAQPAAKK